MKTKYDWNKSRVEEAVKASISYVETLRRLGINTRGNNTDTLKRKIQEYNRVRVQILVEQLRD